ncbi:MAG: trigger factor [Coriobacteriia bacterium]|nr:trigger factor [Coriobacteriia bacterium]
MKVVSKKLQDGRIQLDALACVAEVTTAYERAYQRFANQMNIVPEQGESIAQAAERKMGIKDLDSVVDKFVVDYLAPFAIDKKGISPEYVPDAIPAGRPKRGAEFAFRLVVTPKPQFELSSYDPVTITVPAEEEQGDQVQKIIGEIMEQFTEFVMDENAQGAVVKGDFVRLRMRSTVGGKVINALTADGRTYHVGEGYMPEEFDQNIVGMQVGESKDFTYGAPTFDNDMNTITAAMECHVEVLGKQVPRVPELTDEWVKRCIPMFSSVEEMTEAVKKEVEDQRKADRADLLNRLASEAVVERFEGHISNEAYEHTRDTLIRNVQEGLRNQGTSFNDYVEQMGGKEQFNMMMLFEARQALTQGYALDAVFRHFKMTLTGKDIDEFCKSVDPMNADMVRKDMQESGHNFALRESAERLKAARFLVEHAVVVEEQKA